jgi:hypothetical protein
MKVFEEQIMVEWMKTAAEISQLSQRDARVWVDTADGKSTSASRMP